MSLQIIIDSACDMAKEEAEKNDLMFLPLRTNIDGITYLDGVTVTHQKFYELLASCSQMPVTSQLTPYDYSDAFKSALKDHDEVLVITLSSGLSGTYQSAVIAAEECGGRIYVVDSLNASVGEQVLVRYAVQLRDKSLSAAEIADALEQVKGRIVLLGVVDTLEYLLKGGRISKVSAFAGTMMKIKPILGLESGRIVSLGKAHGAKQSCSNLNRLIAEKGGIDFTMPVMLGYSGQDDSHLQEYIESSRSIWADHIEKMPVCTIGSSIGTHTGPGTIVFGFFSKKQ